MANLGVNIDHVATVREARKGREPDPVWAAALAELGGADGITIHVREDRRHIQDRDLRILRDSVSVPLNLELACAEEVVQLCLQHAPHQATLVPERREEVTTEGGLDVTAADARVGATVAKLQDAGIAVSLFLDPDEAQIDAAHRLRADGVELHTGPYSLAPPNQEAEELERLAAAGRQVRQLGMQLHAGHGLNYRNVQPVARLAEMCDLNIGHSIVSRALFHGMERAVREMKRLIASA